MGASQLATLVVFLGMVGLTGYLLIVLVPSLAWSRMLVETSKIRSALREMIDDEPDLANRRDVQELDAMLTMPFAIGRPPGMTALTVAYVKVARERRLGVAHPVPKFRGLPTPQRIALYLLGHRAALEVVRASILGSRLWFLSWPAWLYISNRLRQGETLRRDSEDDQELSQVLTVGSHFAGPTLQHA